ELVRGHARMDGFEQIVGIVGVGQAQIVRSKFRGAALDTVEPGAVIGGARDEAFAHEAVGEALFVRLQERRVGHARNSRTFEQMEPISEADRNWLTGKVSILSACRSVTGNAPRRWPRCAAAGCR